MSCHSSLFKARLFTSNCIFATHEKYRYVNVNHGNTGKMQTHQGKLFLKTTPEVLGLTLSSFKSFKLVIYAYIYIYNYFIFIYFSKWAIVSAAGSTDPELCDFFHSGQEQEQREQKDLRTVLSEHGVTGGREENPHSGSAVEGNYDY